MGRCHRPFFRVIAIDGRAPRDGKVIEELGYYDPMLPETDARAVLKAERIDHWIGVGAQPSDKVAVLIKKYGTSGTHLDAQAAAMQRLANSRPTAPPPMVVAAPQAEETPPAPAAAAPEEAPSPEASSPEASSPEASTDPAPGGGAAPAPEPEDAPEPETGTDDEP
jgi:small subunit ribosomal protein S16